MGRAKARIGVIVPGNIEIGRAVLRGVRAFCNAHPGSELELISTSGDLASTNFVETKRDCIVTQAWSAHGMNRILENCPHVVTTSNRFPLEGIPRVLNDDQAVGRMGAQYLLGRGFHRLLYAGALGRNDEGGEFLFSRERREGFVQEAQAAGADVQTCSFSTPESPFEIIEQLGAGERPVGIMAASDLHARWFVEAFADPQTAIPGNFAVLGVDDDPLEAALCPVGLSSVRLAGERLGYEAAELGMRLASGEAPPKAAIRIPPLNVVSRQSTSVYATDDPVVSRALRLMQERMAELGDAGDVVKATSVPRRTLEWHFNRALQSTVARELTRTRLRRARELLMNTDLSIKEIAYLIGFSEPRMLSLVFRRETGETPSEFRKRLRPGA